MGIRDRDYMKRPSGDGYDDNDDSGPLGVSSRSDAEQKVGGLLEKNSKILTYAGIALGLLVAIAIFVAARS